MNQEPSTAGVSAGILRPQSRHNGSTPGRPPQPNHALRPQTAIPIRYTKNNRNPRNPMKTNKSLNFYSIQNSTFANDIF